MNGNISEKKGILEMIYSGCLRSNGGKLKNRLERADLDNFGMDWK